MKMLTMIVLFFSLFEAHALEFSVSEMKRSPGFDERYDLQTTLSEELALDCQSFIQGLLFGPSGESAIMMQEWECDELVLEIEKSQGQAKSHCLVVDEVRGTLVKHETCL